jgi:hypothetical protein
MIERLANRRSPYIDVEVAQRLLKALDFVALGLLTLITGRHGALRARARQ